MQFNEPNHPLPRPKSQWRGLGVAERQVWKQDFYVNHPAVKRIFTDSLVRLDVCERSKGYQAMLIIGGTGAGKTTFTRRLREFAQHKYHRLDDEKTVCPVIQFAIPDPCTPFEMSVAILHALGEEQPRARKSKADTLRAAERMLKICETKLVLLDNLQDVPERRGARGIELIGARLRNLIDASDALWVLLGTKDAKRVINGDPQLIRRVAYRAQLDYFGIATSAERQTFSRLLHEVDQWLPLAETSCLVQKQVTGKMYLASEGIFDRIVQLVDHAWVESVRAGREILELEDLAKAFQQVFGPQVDLANPFAPDFVVRRLNGVDEPFEILKGGEDGHPSSKTIPR